MSRIAAKHTSPELRVRRMAHSMGLRFRLHRKDLPGNPDIVFPGRRVAIFVHGCFWHQHGGCPKASLPKTRTEFWQTKFDANVARDERSIGALTEAGWKVAVVWECETKRSETLSARLRAIFGISDTSD